MTARPWTAHELAELKRLAKAGLGHRPIARILNRPLGSVSSRISKLQLNPGRKAQIGFFSDHRRPQKRITNTLPSLAHSEDT